MDIAEDVPAIHADGGQIQQVFINPIAHGADAIGNRAGEITISARRETGSEGHAVRIAIPDPGCGIPSEDLDHIFEPFHTTKGPAATVPVTKEALRRGESCGKCHDGRDTFSVDQNCARCHEVE